MTTLSGLRPLLVTGALVTATLTVSNVPALAADETCDGKPATIVVSTAPVDGSEVNGTPGDDVIVVTTPDQVTVNGLGGHDTICGAAQTSIRGGEGDDVIHGGDGHAVLEGGAGNDTIRGGDGADHIAGDTVITRTTAPGVSDDDSIDAGPGADTVIDDWGNDTLTGGSEADQLLLGVAAVDPKRECRRTIAASATLKVAEGTVTGFGDDTFTGFETYVGGTAEATLIGTSGTDDLRTGECGVAHLVGLDAPDRLQGESNSGGLISANGGADRIAFSGPYDVNAGNGDDRIRLEADYYHWTRPDPDREVRGNRGTDWVIEDGLLVGEIDLRRGFKTWSKKWLAIDGVENVRQIENPFSSGRMAAEAEPEGVIHITGTAGPNVLDGPWSTGTYPVALHGLGGNDRLLGDPRIDTAYGGPGRDFCRAEHRHGCERR
jgi:hypothetical protein